MEFDERLPRMPKEVNMATISRFYGPTDYIELQDEHIKKLTAELSEMRQAIEDASEGSLRGSSIRFFARIVRERDEARAVARRFFRLWKEGQAKLNNSDNLWMQMADDKGYDVEAFEEAMELKNKLP